MIKARGGFTLVELMITMVIMVILTVLAVVVIGNIQVQAQDSEREQDIQTIARGIERYYELGNPFYTAADTKKSYPGSNMMISISGAGFCAGTFVGGESGAPQAADYTKCTSEGYYTEAFPGVSKTSLTPPGFDSPQLVTPWIPFGSVAQHNTAITNALNDNKYVFVPMIPGGTDVCYGETGCTHFELKYKKESTGEIVTIKSKHQQ